ncbi:unnamed protein product [Amoebophrya sp. A25]|nr:unnamed protein product [Amoebophrya sp. A25]|eukprot:GSA25T00013613001.1
MKAYVGDMEQQDEQRTAGVNCQMPQVSLQKARGKEKQEKHRLWVSYEDMLTVYTDLAESPFPFGWHEFEQYRIVCTLFFDKMVQTYKTAKAHLGYLQLQAVLADWKSDDNTARSGSHAAEKSLIVATTNLDQLSQSVFGELATRVVPMHGNIDRKRFHRYFVGSEASSSTINTTAFVSGSAIRFDQDGTRKSTKQDDRRTADLGDYQDVYANYRNLPLVSKPEVLHFAESYTPPFTNFLDLLASGGMTMGMKPASTSSTSPVLAPTTLSRLQHKRRSSNSPTPAPGAEDATAPLRVEAESPNVEDVLVLEIGCSDLVRVVPNIRRKLLGTRSKVAGYFQINPASSSSTSTSPLGSSAARLLGSRSGVSQLTRIPLSFRDFGMQLSETWGLGGNQHRTEPRTEEEEAVGGEEEDDSKAIISTL